MNLKKNKKLKRKYDAVKITYRKPFRMHVYRSEDKNAPFSEWTRVTEEPILGSKFSDPTIEVGKQYYYKTTKVNDDGTEGAPQDPAKGYYTDDDGNPMPEGYNPLNAIVGYHIYRSTDRNLPLDQWERRNPELLPETGFTDTGMEKGVEYFYYVTSVSAAGLESEPSEIINIVGK